MAETAGNARPTHLFLFYGCADRPMRDCFEKFFRRKKLERVV
jgi:hypothetical protein